MGIIGGYEGTGKALMSDEKIKDKGDQGERLPEVKPAPEVQRSAVIDEGSNQARWERAQAVHYLGQDESATGLFKKPGQAPENTCKFGIDGLDKAPKQNANGTPYQVYKQEAGQAVQGLDPLSKPMTESAFQSSVKMQIQATQVPEVTQPVTAQGVLKYTSTVMEAGAQSVRQVEDHLAKPGAINRDLLDMALAGSKAPGYLSDTERVKKDFQSLLTGVAQKVDEVVQQIDKPMKPEDRAKMAGVLLPLFFFEGGKEPINQKVVQEMKLEQMTEEELKALGIERKADKIADDAITKKPEKPAEITPEALDNPEGLAKLAKKFGINMPPKDTYVFYGEKDAVSVEAAAKRLSLAAEQLKNLDEVSLKAHNLERVPDYRDAFFNRHPGLIPVADRIFVHHGIPKWVLKEYPGIFTAREINDVESLRGIYRGVNDELHNTLMHNAWKKFLRDNPAATRKQVLLELEELDGKYGHLFVPTEGK